MADLTNQLKQSQAENIADMVLPGVYQTLSVNGFKIMKHYGHRIVVQQDNELYEIKVRKTKK